MTRSKLWIVECACLVALAGCYQPPAPRVQVSGASPYGQEGIRVTGTAIVRAEPDLAVVTVGCESRASRAGAAKDQNDSTMRRVLDAIKQRGVRARDIQTVTYQLNEGYDRPHTHYWEVVNLVEVRVRSPKNVADVLDAAADSGANRISSVRYEVESLHKLRSKAREEASRIARDKAEQLAGLMGVRVGRAVAINDAIQQQPYYSWYSNYYGNRANTAQSVTQAAPSSSTEQPDDQLASGQVAVEVREEIVFAIE